MLRRSMQLMAGALIAAAVSTAVSAQVTTPNHAVEFVLSRALIERASFYACAQLGPEPAKLAGWVENTWRSDLADATKMLEEAGYPANYVRNLIGRLDLAKATPRFSDRAAREAYCSTLGGWEHRMALFLYSVPLVELPRVLKR